MPPQTDLIPVIGYIRVSLAREEMISPGIQRAAITAWAARTGRRIIGWVGKFSKATLRRMYSDGDLDVEQV